jgi:V/A-type H+-transporting ATPase subunit F
MKKVVLVTPADAAHGFALAGVRQLACDAARAPSVVRDVTRDPLAGLVIVDERLVSRQVQALMRELDRRWPGLVIVLPAPEHGAQREEDYVLQLIRRAIGYQVRLN